MLFRKKLLLFSMGDAEIVRSTAVPVAGFVSGNGINYNYSDDDVVLSGVEIAFVASGW